MCDPVKDVLADVIKSRKGQVPHCCWQAALARAQLAPSTVSSYHPILDNTFMMDCLLTADRAALMETNSMSTEI